MAETAKAALWAERVKDWRASGKSAVRYAEGQGFAESTLRWWASRLRKGDATRFLRLVPAGASVSAGAMADATVVVEIGEARIRVQRGFDGALLRDVVAALGGRQ